MGVAPRARLAADSKTALLLIFVAGCATGTRRGDGDRKPDRPHGSAARAATVIWRPAARTTWQWQLEGTIDDTLSVEMYDIDLFDTPDVVLSGLRARGVKIVCYFSAGSYEEWRPDARRFPAAVLGNALESWPGERWLDIRTTAVQDIMIARLDHARARGCDGVEPDNVDGYANQSGFPLTSVDQLAFNRVIAREAHARGLSVGLKNDLDQARELEPDFDWALVEECAKYEECDRLSVFVDAGKAVFHVEYGDAALAAKICPDANKRDFNTLIKQVSLERFRIACR